MTGGKQDTMASTLAIIFNLGRYGAAFVLALVLVCASFLLVGQPAGLKISIPVTFTIDGAAHRVSAPSLGIQDARILGSTSGVNFEIGDDSGVKPLTIRGSLMFPAQRDAFLVANLIIPIVFLGVLIWALGQLRDLFRSIRDGQPFAAANAARIRSIAIAVIAGELAGAAVTFFEDYYVTTHFTAVGLSFSAPLHVNIFALVNGLIILVIAEVFRAGTRLDEEQSLTV